MVLRQYSRKEIIQMTKEGFLKTYQEMTPLITLRPIRTILMICLMS